MEKRNIILDTDINVEIDDQFALAYLIKNLENFELDAITIAPYLKSSDTDISHIEKNLELSFNVACKMLDIMDVPYYKSKVFKGATKYFFESKDDNPASDKIIEVAEKNKHTTIVAIGAITNVALALRKAPHIASKLDIIWLGGHSFLSENNKEFNFYQDIEAVRTVFESNAELTIVPCKNVASNLITTTYELSHYLDSCGEIGKFLCSTFTNYISNKHLDLKDEVGYSRSLWDLGAVAYLMNKDWFVCKKISRPKIMDDSSYKLTEDKKQINFVMYLDRNAIFNDFFLKMGYKFD